EHGTRIEPKRTDSTYRVAMSSSPPPTDVLPPPGLSGRDLMADDVVEVTIPDAWGDYDVVEKIGEGGMGVVFKVRHARLNRFEVVKVLRTGRFANPKEIERFQFEAEATAALEHPHIVPVYGVGTVGGMPYFAMKWV